MSISLKRNGTLFVVAAPSGGGKSTVLKALLNSIDGLQYSVSVTSRKPRGQEKDGVDFHFVSEEEFHRMVEDKEFYEWAKVHGNYYGTRKSVVEDILRQGYDVTMDIDVQGACQIKGMKPDAVTIFLLPPSIKTLEERLRRRDTDDEEVIRVRLRNATAEISQCHLFDYLVMNDDIDHAIDQIRSIIEAERQKGSRQEVVIQDEPGLR
ncbi:MAG: guanylate kinase [Candidatus Sumerlaeia bacterium]